MMRKTIKRGLDSELFGVIVAVWSFEDIVQLQEGCCRECPYGRMVALLSILVFGSLC